MNAIRCKICGGKILPETGLSRGRCESCGGECVIPRTDDAERLERHDLANDLRLRGEYDRALAAYEALLEEDPADAEAHWGAALSRFGVEYVPETETGRWVPVCHCPRLDRIVADPDYLAALRYAPDSAARELYRQQADAIARNQQGPRMPASPRRVEPPRTVQLRSFGRRPEREPDSDREEGSRNRDAFRNFERERDAAGAAGRELSAGGTSPEQPAPAEAGPLEAGSGAGAGEANAARNADKDGAGPEAGDGGTNPEQPAPAGTGPEETAPGAEAEGENAAKDAYKDGAGPEAGDGGIADEESAPAGAGPEEAVYGAGTETAEQLRERLNVLEMLFMALLIIAAFGLLLASRSLARLAMGAALVLEADVLPEIRYRLASSLRKKGMYRESYEMYTRIDGYKDSGRIISGDKAFFAIACEETGRIVTYGHYPQTASGSDRTPIEWVVLQFNEQKGRSLLLSRYGLDAQPYNWTAANVTWETCSLRNWLNEKFLLTAFTAKEREAILETKAGFGMDQRMDRRPIDGGKKTWDSIFLLSREEWERYQQSMKKDKRPMQPQASATEYAVSKGVWFSSTGKLTEEGKKTCYWWLRSPGSSQVSAVYVDCSGTCCETSVDEKTCAVRPALWVDPYKI